jgi:hypothetical protein
MDLAESCDLHGIVAEHVRIDGHKGANPGGEVATLVAGMLAGADSIDDADDLHMPEYWPWQRQWLRLRLAIHAPPA